MPDVGSSYSTVKSAVRDRLQERAGLTGVTVSYNAPRQAADVRASSGSYEMIFLDDVDDGEYDNVVICGVPLRIEENYHVKLIVQVLKPSSTGTQEEADRRVDELLWEVMHELASDPTFGIDVNPGPGSHFDHINITRGDFSRDTGFIEGTNGYAARCELDLDVTCRISFP